MRLPPDSPRIERVFGEVLRRLRTEKGLSQEELADESELHRTYVSQIERGLKSPSLETMRRLAVALGISLPKLMDQVWKDHMGAGQRIRRGH